MSSSADKPVRHILALSGGKPASYARALDMLDPIRTRHYPKPTVGGSMWHTSTNLKYMRLVFLAFPNRHTLCDQLSWSHYRTLASVENAKKRQFYREECAKSGWGVRDLQRQISTQFYERLLANHVDLVFYNFLARCFFLVDLKVGKITPEDLGQMQLYKHYYERERMNPGDNPPVGIVLGSDRDEAVIRYTLNERERNLFAVKYHLNLPTEEELRRELQRERAAFEEAQLLAAPQKVARARIRNGKK